MAKKKKKKVNKNQIIASVIIVLLLIAVAIVVFYISNNYSFNLDFWLSPKESASDSGNIGESDSDVEIIPSDKIRDLKITFMDIGQGDSILIEFPDGKNMLIDSGDKRNSSKAVFNKYLKDENGNKIKLDYCVATHPDSDHIGLMDYIYQEYDIEKSYRPYVYSTYKDASTLPEDFNAGINIKTSSQIYYKYIKSVYDEKTYWEFFNDDSDFTNKFKGSDGKEYSYTVDFAMPYVSSNLEGFGNFKTPNDFSAIIMIKYAGRKILLTGDIENESGKNGSESLFVKYNAGNADMDCDVLKVAHHGSDSSTSPTFLNIVKPEYSVISCGLSNKHHHPLKSTINNITSANSGIYRTDLQGTIILTVGSGGEMKFETQTENYNGMILDDGDEVKAYETAHGNEIENYKLKFFS